MRILAIRGRNLASLAGDFEIRLDAPPLADAGLFAITGRTGSGKSTTLDALCLALFDRVPRLPGGRGVEVGRADDAPDVRLRNNDVRSILRRGTGEGHAEVDFLGVDGHRYRARWSLRRARRRADGRFQAQEMSLLNLDSEEDLSGTKTEVLDAIQQRLGLTFDQFRRSVLLAQGDFAAFLRAGPGERAELLERITGTGIYGEISRTVHRRAADERAQLELVRQRLGDQRPMDEEERQALEAELEAARRMRDEQLLTRQRLEQAQRWYQTLDKLNSEQGRAAEALTRALAEQAVAEPRCRSFERVRALQPLRLPLEAADRAADAVSEAERDLESSLREELQRQAAADQAAADASKADCAFGAAEQAARDAVPVLQAARRLDTEIEIAREQVERATAEHEAARRLSEEVRLEQERLQALSDRAEESFARAGDWLAAHSGIESLASQWEAWSRELDRYVRAREAFNGARAAIDAAAEEGGRLAGLRKSVEDGAVEIETDRGRAAAERARLESEAAGFDLDLLAGRRDELSRRRDQVTRLRELARQAAESSGRVEVARHDLYRERKRRAESEARLREIDSGKGPLEAALREAEETHRRMLLASAGEVEALRARLRDGEPCPVCGSAHHPWSPSAAPALGELAGEQAARVEELKDRVSEMTAEHARRRTESEQADRRIEELQSDLDTHQALLGQTLEAWSALGDDPLRPADPIQDGLEARQRQELEALSRNLEQVAADEHKARDLHAAMRSRTKEIERLDKGLDAMRTEQAGLDERIRAGADARSRAEIERVRAEETMGQILALISEPFGGIEDWRTRLQGDPEDFKVDCGREVAAWLQWIERRDEAHKTRQDLAPRLAQALARLRGAEEGIALRRDGLEKQSGALAILMDKRSGVLDGRPAQSVESDLSAAVEEARRTRERIRLVHGKAREDLKTAQGAVVTRRKALEEREKASAKTREALNLQMADQGVTLEDLREALRHDHDWVERERLELQALTDACERSRELLKERERRVAEHRDAESPELSAEAVSERLSLAAKSLKTAQDQWGQLHGRLGEDDRRRERSREIRAELEQRQEAWELWESLRELIGSADGSKFRNFAQGLTLDLLVAHANEHLRELARRYELQRVPGAEMEIQVIDREMGDEVRSIHSLSGGESFLASLALALGLASLASDRVQVESLFIDEGFGALDADSLDLAIASLDALYSLGRQVGVISHVGTLVERIGVKVQINKHGGGRSRLEVVTQ
jgi:exonuclease SbcC